MTEILFGSCPNNFGPFKNSQVSLKAIIYFNKKTNHSLLKAETHQSLVKWTSHNVREHPLVHTV